ncbi:MAG: YetF domain-containing protein [Luteolibacter sp.]
MISADPILDVLFRVMLLGPLCLIWISLVVRVIGLRSFSKMTAFDFITTVATGSLLATAAGADSWSAFFQSSGAMFALLAMQALIAWLRIRSSRWMNQIENEPILLMEDGVVISANMTKARVTKEDLLAKLREANVLQFSQVRAVVLETTGDISVLHGDELEEELLESVRRR